ncbi:MAG: RelA/SpoT domain-containing protein [Chloroflexota bacterium]
MAASAEQHDFAGLGYSRSQVDAAGDTLRKWSATATLLWGVPEADALAVALAYRAAHQASLTSVVMGLRSMVKTVGAPVIVAQRLKRMPAIVGKLARFPRMDLSRMQDIGGCRAILPDQGTVTKVRRRISKNGWKVDKEYDYVSSPKDTGYRALHVVVVNHDRLVEVQLRTAAQHSWAEAVEKIELRRRYGLKDGTGPQVLMELLRQSAYAMDHISRGEVMSAEFDREFDELRRRAKPHL